MSRIWMHSPEDRSYDGGLKTRLGWLLGLHSPTLMLLRDECPCTECAIHRLCEEWRFLTMLGGKEWVRNRWENRWAHKAIKMVPGELRFWIMVGAVVRASKGGPPDSVTYKQLHEEMVKERWFR